MNLHIFNNTNHKFSEPFFDFVENNFNKKNHTFLIWGDYSINKYKYRENLVILSNENKISKLIKLFKLMYKSDRIFIHQLFFPFPLMFLYSFQKKILKKSYWVIWGGDLYHYKFRNKGFKSDIYEFMRRKVIKNIGNIVALVEGDYELAKKWYKTEAVYHEAFYYSPQFCENIDETNNTKKRNKKIIQIGNSADPSNNHIEILNKLLKFKDKDIEIIVPLSYGDREWAKEVIKNGQMLYGDKFRSLDDFLPPQEYRKILNSVDVAIFNHDRQQALGNILILLHLGKKVFVKNDITTWNFLKKKELTVYNTYDIDKLNFEEFIFLDESTKEKNREMIEKEFSEEKCVRLWKNIFNS